MGTGASPFAANGHRWTRQWTEADGRWAHGASAGARIQWRSVRKKAGQWPSPWRAAAIKDGRRGLNAPRAFRREIPNGGAARGVHWRSAREEKACHRPSAARPGPMEQVGPAKRAAIGGEGRLYGECRRPMGIHLRMSIGRGATSERAPPPRHWDRMA